MSKWSLRIHEMNITHVDAVSHCVDLGNNNDIIAPILVYGVPIK